MDSARLLQVRQRRQDRLIEGDGQPKKAERVSIEAKRFVAAIRCNSQLDGKGKQGNSLIPAKRAWVAQSDDGIKKAHQGAGQRDDPGKD